MSNNALVFLFFCLCFKPDTGRLSEVDPPPPFLLCLQFSSILACSLRGSRWRFLDMAAVVSYSPPWWVNLLHRLPHFNLKFEQTSSDFQPEDWTYQQVKDLTVHHKTLCDFPGMLQMSAGMFTTHVCLRSVTTHSSRMMGMLWLSTCP